MCKKKNPSNDMVRNYKLVSAAELHEVIVFPWRRRAATQHYRGSRMPAQILCLAAALGVDLRLRRRMTPAARSPHMEEIR